MKITGDSKIKEVLAIDEEKMIKTLMWIAPEFERFVIPNCVERWRDVFRFHRRLESPEYP
ncbi:MAG: hypothetical protein ABIR33_11185 [Pyrinomonadaceae bacterium]